MPHNRKQGAVYFQGAQEFTPQRHKFLDGTWKTYFAPGQMPNVIGQAYQRATDWNKAETCLRPPQVVWLECRLQWSQSFPWYDYAEMHAGPYEPAGTAVLGQIPPEDSGYMGHLGVFWGCHAHAPDSETKAWQYQDVQQNVALVEKWRLMGEFQAAKATIERIRPGRTWVNAINWMDAPGGYVQAVVGTAGSWLFSRSIADIGTIEKNLLKFSIDPRDSTIDTTWTECDAGFVEVPNVSYPNDRYFGTDFLGVFCGNHYFQPGAANDYSLYQGATWPTDTTGTDLPGFSQYQGAFARLRGFGSVRPGETPTTTVDRFANKWATRLYHPGITWGHWLTADEIPAPPEGTMTEPWRRAGNDLAMYPTGESTALAYISTGIDDRQTTQQNAYSAGLFDAVATQAANNLDPAGNPAPIDITHPGDTSMITAGYLVNLIASHYHFDPETGKDLG